MMRSLYAGISGLGVNQKAMDVLGNNISNVNTIGYKSGRAVFQDLLSQTLVGGKAPTDTSGGVNPRQVGLGSYLAAVDTIFLTGTMQTTSKNTDLAIQGEGFFVIRGESESDLMYTRAGDFNFDSSGALTSPGGYNVQGWLVDPETGELRSEGAPTDIILSADYQTAQAKPTSEVTLAGVLDVDADPTIVEYPALLHYADPADSLFAIYGENGANVDLSDNEAIKVKAHTSASTDMAYVYNESDVSLNMENDTSLIVYINSVPTTLQYGSGTNSFTTAGGLAQRIEDLLDTAAGAADQFNVYVTNGTIKVDRIADNGTNVTINSFSGSPILAVALANLANTYDDAGDTKSGKELFYESHIYAGRDFTSLSDLAVAIENELDGAVIPSDAFSVTYDSVTGKMQFAITATSATGTLGITGFSLDKAYSGTVFENNIVPAGSSTIIATSGNTTMTTSAVFLRTAQDNDPLTELITTPGVSLGLDSSAILQFSASVDGENVPGTASIPVSSASSTLQTLRTAIANYMGFDSSSESELSQHIGSFDTNSGKLVITGEKGTPNEIDFLKFEVVGIGNYEAFYDYFEYQTVQEAEGGSVSTSQTVYDSQGMAHTIQYTFEMEDSVDNVWKMTISSPEDLQITFNETTGNEVFMHFNSNGSFNYLSSPGGQRIADLTMNIDPGTGAGVISDIEVNIGSPSRFDGIYIASDGSGINTTKQDGYTTGTLESTLFNPAGEIIGYYTNGQVTTIAQIALATFTNPQGLLKIGDTIFRETSNSGAAAIGKPETGFRGEIASGALENSNVDLSTEFVSMITTQRGFQANSRIITTSDEMLQELMSLKR
jgi:flagellar hook protein FlgE